MTRRCLKCKKEISQNDFICPHCGLIIGDPVSYATSVQTKQSAKSKFSFRRVIYFLLTIALIASVGVVLWLVYPYLLPSETVDATQHATTEPAPTETTAPLVVYTVKIGTVNKTKLTGSYVHIYSGDQVLYSSQVGDDGTATFILPEFDGYSVRLTDLPVQYQVNYGEASFFFEAGQRELSVTLEELPVTYTIRIVNSAGEPMPGTGIIFYCSGEDDQEKVTDENGICTFVTEYNNGTHSASISFTPNGYVALNDYITFKKDRLEFEVEIQTYEEAGYNLKDIYTIRVVDEYGDPVPFVRLAVAGMFTNLSGQGIWKSGATNMEGCFSFCYPEDLQCRVQILENIDYRETVFEFEEGDHDMQIQLDLYKEPGDQYTYTLYFRHQNSGTPVPGVQIAVTDDLYSGTAEYYTSDENGVIVFELTESDPSLVHFYVISSPDGYTPLLFADHQYSFYPYSRSFTVELKHDGKVTYKVYLKDTEGLPVKSAAIGLYLLNDELHSVFIDDQGCGTFRLYPTEEFVIDRVGLHLLPDEYEKHIVSLIEYGQERSIHITIAPPDANNVYTVTFQHPETGTVIPGVQIAVTNDYYSLYSDGTEFYTSDENGVITFESTKVDPATVSFYVISCPDDYTTALHEYTKYSFQSYSRNLTVSMQYDGKVVYKLYLKDQEGQPVPYSYISFRLDEEYWGVYTDDQGFGTFRLNPDNDYRMENVSLGDYPDKYENYVVVSITYDEDRCIYIKIEPSPIPGQGGHDE